MRTQRGFLPPIVFNFLVSSLLPVGTKASPNSFKIWSKTLIRFQLLLILYPKNRLTRQSRYVFCLDHHVALQTRSCDCLGRLPRPLVDLWNIMVSLYDWMDISLMVPMLLYREELLELVLFSVGTHTCLFWQWLQTLHW